MVDLEKMLEPAECDAIEVAADLIEELRIAELLKIVPTLRSIRDSLSETIDRRS